MKIKFDQKKDILRIKFQEGKYEISKEIDEGIIIDFSKDKKLIAIEILDVSEKIPKKDMKDITIGISE
jgi:uncharacterized protein YuzE